MLIMKCDRCGEVYKPGDIAEYPRVYPAMMMEYCDLCPRCTESLKERLKDPNSYKSTEPPPAPQKKSWWQRLKAWW